jgi:hypothetical protein
MERKVKEGIYTTGKESFRLSILDNGQVVEIDAQHDIPFLELKAGEKATINKSSFESFLNRELRYYFWQKE